MIINFKNVIVLSPHTDDGELGCGGTISRLLGSGAKVHYVAFSTAEKSVPKHLPPDILKQEVKVATASLGIESANTHIFDFEVRRLNESRQEILQILVDLNRKISPDLILQPCLNDIHQDHATVAMEGLRAFKNKTILGYELIWNNLTFNTTAFVSLDEADVELKCRALTAYKSQSERPYMKQEFIRSLAVTRGVQVGCKFAETFEVIRLAI